MEQPATLAVGTKRGRDGSVDMDTLPPVKQRMLLEKLIVANEKIARKGCEQLEKVGTEEEKRNSRQLLSVVKSLHKWIQTHELAVSHAKTAGC